MDEKDQQSRFNDNQWLIERISYILIECNRLSVNGDFIAWRWKLDVIWRELTGAIIKKFGSKPEDNAYMKRKDALDAAVSVAFKLNSKTLMYKALDKKERFLREIKDDAGLGISWMNPDEGESMTY